MAQIRVHLIGKVERRAAHRHIDDFALGRHDVDAVLEQIDAHAIEKIAAAFSLPSAGASSERSSLILRS